MRTGTKALASEAERQTAYRAPARGSSTLLPVVVDVLALGGLLAVGLRTGFGSLLMPLVAGVGLGCVVLLLRAATTGGTLTGALLCAAMLSLRASGVHPPNVAPAAKLPPLLLSPLLLPLVLLCGLTIAATRFGRTRKQRLGLAESKRGRDAGQIAANLGAAALAGVAAHWQPVFVVGAVAAMVEATADTLSSEIGQALGGTTVLLTTGRRVPPGTDGGVSLRGTAAGLAGAAAIAGVAWWSGFTASAALFALVGGVFGFVVDSALGATVERRGWIRNDAVNLSSTVAAAALGTVLAGLLH
jgi:uncharacterized protein (TIGR00297 family)